MKNNHSFFERVKEKSESLSPKQVQLAKYLIGNYKTVAFQTVSQVARAARVSEATVVRLATYLDYSGYPEMLEEFQQIVQYELKAYEHIRYTYKSEQLKQFNLLETVVKNDQRNISKLLESVNVADVEIVADKIHSADQVIIVGLYSASYLAQYFGYNLAKVKNNVAIINKDSMDAYNTLLTCGSGTTVIMLSFPRYTQKVLALGEVFRSKGAMVIGITDSIMSPLKAFSNQILLVPQQYTSFTDPGCAIMLLLQAIILEYLSRNPDQTEEYLKQFDEYVDQMKYF